MRHHPRLDANHKEVADALRKVGCTVQSLASVGRGCPDLLVGFRRRNVLMEVKDGKKPPSRRALTPEEVHWHEWWMGQTVVVESPEQAVNYMIAVSM